MSPALSALYIYPLKSAAAVSLQTAMVLPRGLRGDRRWMVVDDKGRFITSRELPTLLGLRAHADATGLALESPDGSRLHIETPRAESPAAEVSVWSDDVTAHLADATASAWLSDQLQRTCRLVYMHDQTQRPVDPQYARPTDIVSFADGFPILLTSESSLEDLGTRIGESMAMLRFRPNLVIRGAAAFAEDSWTRIQIGEAVLGVAKPCARCVLTTRDPETGARHPSGEPLRTLATYRRQPGGVMFGQNLTVLQPGRVTIDDPVHLIE